MEKIKSGCKEVEILGQNGIVIKTEDSTESLCGKDAEFELEEDFIAVWESIKSEDMKIDVQDESFDNNSSTLYKISGQRSNISEANIDHSLPSFCRLCATRRNDLIDLLGTTVFHKKISEEIEHCLPIKVIETDRISKKACRSCLEKLELCYQFHRSVAQAEKQLLLLDKQTSVAVKEEEEEDVEEDEEEAEKEEVVEKEKEQEAEKEAGHCEVSSCSLSGEPVPMEEDVNDVGELTIVSDESIIDIEANGLNNLEDNGTRSVNEDSNILEVELRTEDISETPRNSESQTIEPAKDKEIRTHRRKQSFASAIRKEISEPNKSLRASGETYSVPYSQRNDLMCYHCGKVFTQRANLGRHLKIHSGERPYDCEICKRTFRVKEHRDNHRRTHTDERSFKCSVCDKEFKHSQTLYRHARVHATIKYDCTLCIKSYKDRYARDKHMLAKHNIMEK